MIPPLELSNASVDRADRPILRNVSLTVSSGEVVGVIGINGSGKTTLLRAALGLVRLSGGEARLAGRVASALSDLERSGLAGYLPQERRVAWNMCAWRIAAMGAPHRAPVEARRRAFEALDEVGLADLAERGVRDMSGGERARVLVARLICADVPLLVADEPASGLDPDAALRIMAVLRARATAGAAVIATLHDLTLAAAACDRLAVLAGGALVAVGAPAKVLAPDVLARAFNLSGGLHDTPSGPAVAVRRR